MFHLKGEMNSPSADVRLLTIMLVRTEHMAEQLFFQNLVLLAGIGLFVLWTLFTVEAGKVKCGRKPGNR